MKLFARCCIAPAGALLLAVSTVASAQAGFTETRLIASDAQTYDFYGVSMAITNDYVAVGRPGYDILCPNARSFGAVYVYTRADGWREQTQLVPSDPTCGKHFGEYGAVAASGNTILVGAYADAQFGYRSGAAYVFVRDPTGWHQEARLVPPDASASAYFGFRVALEGDTAAITAEGDNGFTGAAYVFVRSAGVWTLQAKLVPSPAVAGMAAGGGGLALSGGTLAMSGNDSVGAGTVYVFDEIGGAWIQSASLTRGVAGDYLGTSLGLSGDTLVAGATYLNGGYAGSATIFVRSGTIWTEQATLAAPDNGEPTPLAPYFGFTVAIDGDTIVVGAPWGYQGDGEAWLFTRSASTWSPRERLLASTPTFRSAFGIYAAIFHDTIGIGSYAETFPYYTGAAYIFSVTTPPVVTIATSASPAASGWYNRDSSGNTGVPVAVSASDPTGVTNITCTDNGTAVLNTGASAGSFILFDGGHAITCTATDGVNSTGAATGSTPMPVVYRIDQTPPVLAVPADITVNATSPAGAFVTYVVSATDLVSGIAAVTCAPASGSVFAIATTVVNCSATDRAGNVEYGGFSVTVLSPAQIVTNLIDDVSVDNFSQASHLLQNLLKSLNAGNGSAACGQIGAFINQVQAQSGKKLSSAQATQLIDAAANARSALGCS